MLLPNPELEPLEKWRILRDYNTRARPTPYTRAPSRERAAAVVVRVGARALSVQSGAWPRGFAWRRRLRNSLAILRRVRGRVIGGALSSAESETLGLSDWFGEAQILRPRIYRLAIAACWPGGGAGGGWRGRFGRSEMFGAASYGRASIGRGFGAVAAGSASVFRGNVNFASGL